MDKEIVKKLGNTTVRIVPPKLTSEERERARVEIKRAVWEIVRRKGERKT